MNTHFLSSLQWLLMLTGSTWEPFLPCLTTTRLLVTWQNSLPVNTNQRSAGILLDQTVNRHFLSPCGGHVYWRLNMSNQYTLVWLTEPVGSRRPWLPTNKTPHDRDEQLRELQAPVADPQSMLPVQSGSGTTRNQSISRRRAGLTRSFSTHRARSGVDTAKVTESCLQTSRHTAAHRLLVVSTAPSFVWFFLVFS